MKKTATTPKTPAVKKTKKATAIKKKAVILPEDVTEQDEEATMVVPMTQTKRNPAVFGIIALLVILGVVLFKFQYVLVPARVNGRPVYVWQYAKYLHQTYGKEAIQTLTTQRLIDDEIAKSKVVVKQEDIQKEIDTLDKQASSSGGIQAMLTAQQMSMDQLKDQIRIKLAVTEIIKDKLKVSDAEVADAYSKNKDFFKGVPEAEAKDRIRTQLEGGKFQTEASNWLAEVRKTAKIEVLFPGLESK